MLTMPDPVLNARDLTIGYAAPRRAPTVVAERLAAALYPGELVCLAGPNGAGKSTLLRTLAGMQPALAGEVRLGGDLVAALEPRERARRMSIVLTDRVEDGHLTAYALAALGRHPYTDWTGRLSAHDEAVVRWAMEAVGARPLAARPISELSDGERQKIMIARALAQEPLVMLLDEPTAFLDLPNRVEIMRVLRALTRQTGRAILLSTHDLDLALRSADRLWLLPHGGPLHDGAPEDLVLSGALEATFHSEGIAFDRQTGTFAIVAARTGGVALVGAGVTALWTRRALEREGYCVAEEDGEAFARVEVLGGEESPRWRCTVGGIVGEYDSLHALIAALRAAQA